MKDFITVKVFKAVQRKASHCFGFPIRMRPELKDEFNRRPLEDVSVEGSAAKEGLHLETLQITEAVHWTLAQKLRQLRGKQI